MEKESRIRKMITCAIATTLFLIAGIFPCFAAAFGEPAVPNNFSATSTIALGITLSWVDNATDELGYTIEHSVDGINFVTFMNASADSISALHTLPALGVMNYYRIRSYNTQGYSAYAATSVFVPLGSLFASSVFIHSPFYNGATYNDEGVLPLVFPGERPSFSFTLGSSSSSEDVTATAYQVQVRTGSGDLAWLWDSGKRYFSSPVRVGETTPDVLSGVVYDVLGVGESETYYVAHIKFWDQYGNENYWTLNSDPGTFVVSYGTFAAAPSDFIAAPLSSTEIALAWTDRATNEDGYQIERSFDGTNFVQIATTTISATDYLDTELSPSTQYYYRLRAFNSVGTSNYATTSTVTFSVAPSSPVGLQVNRFLNPVDVHTPKPTFSAIFEDLSTSALAVAYEVQVTKVFSDWDNLYWDSGKTSFTSGVSVGTRSHQIIPNILFPRDGSTYYWRIKFWDQLNVEGEWSDESAVFTMHDNPGNGHPRP